MRASATRKKSASAPSTPLREQFALEILIDFDIKAAWQRANAALGFKVPKTAAGAYKALKDPNLNELIQARRAEVLNRAGINVERTEREIARLAYVDISQFYDTNGLLLPLHLIPEDARRAILSVESEELFDFSDEEDVRRRLDEAEVAIGALLGAVQAMKGEAIPAALALPLGQLKAWARPAKGKSHKYLVGHVKKVKIADKKGALELAGRRDGIFRDRIEHSGSVTLEQIIAESHKEPSRG